MPLTQDTADKSQKAQQKPLDPHQSVDPQLQFDPHDQIDPLLEEELAEVSDGEDGLGMQPQGIITDALDSFNNMLGMHSVS